MTDLIDAPSPVAEHPTTRPRIRTGAVFWGLVLIALAAFALVVVAATGGRDAVIAAVLALDGFGWTIVAVVALGGTTTLLALAAVIRRAQHRRGTLAAEASGAGQTVAVSE